MARQGRNAAHDSPPARPPEPLGRLLSVPEAAAILGVSPITLRQWLSQGRVALVKVGRLTKLRPEDVQAFIARHHRPARPAAEDL